MTHQGTWGDSCPHNSELCRTCSAPRWGVLLPGGWSPMNYNLCLLLGNPCVQGSTSKRSLCLGRSNCPDTGGRVGGVGGGWEVGGCHSTGTCVDPRDPPGQLLVLPCRGRGKASSFTKVTSKWIKVLKKANIKKLYEIKIDYCRAGMTV